jgi:hypothetical protein
MRTGARRKLSTFSVDNSAQNIPGLPNFPWILTSSLLCLFFVRNGKTLFSGLIFREAGQIPEKHEGFAT